MKNILKDTFYRQSTQSLAKALLGTYLVTDSKEGITIGKIVETEAYLSKNDPACHAHLGMTKRNQVMFKEPGHAYVYLCYGMYQLFNVVSGAKGVGEAVLIRALEPIVGVELMKKRRNSKDLKNLSNGPGKLVIAMGISEKDNGKNLQSQNLHILSRIAFDQDTFKVKKTTRIGISKAQELELRFYIEGSKFISKT